MDGSSSMAWSNYEDRRAGRGEMAYRRPPVTVPPVDRSDVLACPRCWSYSRPTYLQDKESRTVTGPIRLGCTPRRIEVRDDVTQSSPSPKVATLLGQIPRNDGLVDHLHSQRLVGSPEHDGHWQAEVF